MNLHSLPVDKTRHLTRMAEFDGNVHQFVSQIVIENQETIKKPFNKNVEFEWTILGIRSKPIPKWMFCLIK